MHAKGLAATFSPNGGDEILQNGLQTGDIMLFQRRWYRYHLPEALCIGLYQLWHKTPFDHCGMIVCDKYGAPHVFESTFFAGCKLRPFEPRVLLSQSQQIILIPLLPRADFATPALQQLIASSVHGAGRYKYHITSSLASSLVGLQPSPHLVAGAYAAMGIRSRNMSNACILQRTAELSLADASVLSPTVRGTRLHFSKQDVLVRTN